MAEPIKLVRIPTLKTVTDFRNYVTSLGIDLPCEDAIATGSASALTQPCDGASINGKRIGNRFAIQPMEGWDGTNSGGITDEVLRRWQRFGESGAKLIYGGEAMAVRSDGRANPNQLIINEENKSSLSKIREALLNAHRARYGSTDDLVIGFQLTHSGRFCKPNDKFRMEPRVAYRHPILDNKFKVTSDAQVWTDAEIEQLIQNYVQAAKVAADVGADFVDIKHCHGYLLHEFLSAYIRPGKYGGSFENRTRILREIISGIRASGNKIDIGVRLSAFDFVPFKPDAALSRPGKLGPGVPEDFSHCLPYRYAFGVNQSNPVEYDLAETFQFVDLCHQLGVKILNVSAGSPYYNPHIQRPAIYPPSDGYQPPEDPLVGVARQINVVRQIKARAPKDLIIVGTGYSYLQEYLPHVAQYVVRNGWTDVVGLGRMVLAYPELLADAVSKGALATKSICRTFSDCTTAPRNGMISGCYPLDKYYSGKPEFQKLKEIKKAVGVVLLLLSICIACAKEPNIMIILSDDMGFSDLGCYGSEIRTPNLDKLAAEGVRFTQFYNNARCCPTRASFLTGLYPHEAGIGHMTTDQGYDGYRGQLNRQCVTIAEVMRTAGYHTYMCGKWHVCRDIRPNGDKSDWPIQRGFERFYGTITGGGSYYDPTSLCRQNKFVTPENDPEYKPERFYYTDAITDNAIQFLRQHRSESAGKPFFFYVAYTAAHWPMHAPEEDIAKYRGKYDAGYEPIRKGRYQREKELGLIKPDWELSGQAGDWDQVQNKPWEARCMEVYAAMVEHMDRGIGKIIEQLRESGDLDNTLILFLQDNGACAEDMGRTDRSGKPPANLKPFGPDDLQPHVWPPMQTRDGRWVRSGPGVMPGPADTYVAYGRSWANVSNTPFREYKHWVHEGGISTPLIVHWPTGIRASRNGKLEPQPGHIIDLMTTCVEAGGARYPSKFNGEKIKPMEGISLIRAFNGKPLTRSEPLFWEHEGNRAVREGKWKLVAKENQPWELYDVDRDRSEMNDLASKNPRKVQELAARWDTFAQRANILPLGAWHGKATRAAD